ncbi:MAG TPA: ABC transporter permease, partial [Thermoanaerobaculia bacterium]|nr:ABC transporter permease [Thermoanaerobaculia bacterium]
MGSIGRDVVFGVRMLGKRPGFTLVVVLILALGLGANTAIFSVLHSVILRPLPFPDADRLVMVRGSHFPDEMGEEVAIANLLDWRRENRSFDQLGAYAPASLNLTGGDTPERIETAQVSPGAMAALGVQPVLGRLFLADEEGPESRLAILSYGIWRSHFGGDPDILGEVIRLSGIEYPVVGVMPPDFQFPSEKAQLWFPLRITEDRANDRRERWAYPFGRLKAGVSLVAAQADMDRVTAALAQEYPEFNKNWGVRLVPLHQHLVGEVRPALLTLQVTVFLLLLLACANVANLQLARAASRRTEMAVRSAIGASSPAILRQLLIEGMILAGLGGLVGLLLAFWGLRLLIAINPDYIPRLDQVGIDPTVLLFTLGLAALTGLVFGLVPARSALKRNLVQDLQEGSATSSSGLGQIHFRRLLTVFEVVGSLVLMIGAGLLLASLSHLRSVEPGFNPEDVVTLELVLPRSRYPDGPQRAAFFREIAERASGLPGVNAAGGTSSLPLSGSSASASY